MDDPAEQAPIYLDNQATTPVDPRVLEAMLPYFTQHFGNPHSVHHAYGWRAVADVQAARAQVAELINAEAREIVFTSGATESNNLAIKGAARFLRRKGKAHVVTAATEHKCVLESCRALEREGFRLTVLLRLRHDPRRHDHLARRRVPLDDQRAEEVLEAQRRAGAEGNLSLELARDRRVGENGTAEPQGAQDRDE